MTVEQLFLDYVKRIGAYQEALGVLYWDMRTGAPKKGIDQRAEVVGVLSTDVFNLSTSDELKRLLDQLEPTIHRANTVTKRVFEEVKKEYELSKKIPADEYKQFVILQSKAEAIWEEAKNKNDWPMFMPYLKEIIDTLKRFVQYWGVKDNNAYNVLLDQYEQGMTTEILDSVFNDLRNRIVPLVKKITVASIQPQTDFLFKNFPKEQQKAFSLDVLHQLGYDLEAGRLDETIHPFEIGLNRGDVRITTKYDESDFRSAIFGTIHECGHAIYEQNVAESLTGTPLSGGSSMGIHESQSLFYENFVGRHPKFWERNYKKLQQYSPEQFDNIRVEDFLQAINVVKPSLIRIEADELTYALHIMIRYEIEKGIFNGDLKVEDLPEIWNAKYEEYLGVRPSSNAEGILQDVHWAGASFGYFPSYALGYMYAAQFKAAMLKDLPAFDELVEKGDLSPIKDWLTQHIHQYGALKKPLELVKDATGEGLNGNYLADYLEEKYTRIYQLS